MTDLRQRQVHLDFHTSGQIEGIGEKFNKEQFKSCLKKGHVNSVTVFAKCHHGWGYSDFETILAHPYLSRDLLGEMLDACREADVEAPVYISAGLDENYAVNHPEHVMVRTIDGTAPKASERDGIKYFEGEPHWHRLCMNTPYLDLLCKQISEVVKKYMPIGIFLDIVGEGVCYCEHCRALVRAHGWDENDNDSYVKLSKETYKKYYEATNKAAKDVKSDVRVFHNSGHITCGRRDLAYANTHLELESLPTGGWGYDHFPQSAKYVANLGMDYLGMTGKFHTSWGEFGGFKHPNALRYEIALSLAHGAKCSIGDQLHPSGSMEEATYELIGKAYEEAEKMEEYCYGIKPVCDIGVISLEAFTNGADKKSVSDVGVSRMLLEGKYLFNVLDTECDLDGYKLLILPDRVSGIKPEFAKKLESFVKKGGKVLCSGTSGTDENGEFLFDFGIKLKGQSKFEPSYYRPEYDALGLSPAGYIIYSRMYETDITDESAQVLGYSHHTYFNRTDFHFCSHRHTPMVSEKSSPALVIGSDGAYIAFELFFEYAKYGSYILKDTFIKAVEALIGDKKTVKTNLPSGARINLNHQMKENRDVLHLLYASQVKRGDGIEVIEDTVPLYDTHVELKTAPVSRVVLVPQNEEIAYTYENGVCKFTVEKFACNQAVAIYYGNTEAFS